MADLTGKKVLMVLAPENFRDEEFVEPKAVLERAGAEITTASKANHARGMLGEETDIDILYTDANPDDYDAVIFVGGNGASIYFDDPVAQKLARVFFDADKLTCAICIAPSILANAGVLKNKKATCYSSEEGNLGSKGAIYTGEDVEVDGNVITANGPKAAHDFGLEIRRHLV